MDGLLSINGNSIRLGGPAHGIVTKTTQNSAKGWWGSRRWVGWGDGVLGVGWVGVVGSSGWVGRGVVGVQ